VDADVSDTSHTARAADQLATARTEVHDLASGLFPRLIVDIGLASALRDLASRSSVPVELQVSDGVSGGPEVDATIYFVLAEALANVARHARATHVQVRVSMLDGVIHLAVHDNGVGGADATSGTGIRGLRDRVEALAGTLAIDSPAGTGTRLDATIPVDPEARDAA
jgi:signal transduction histidine kinase